MVCEEALAPSHSVLCRAEANVRRHTGTTKDDHLLQVKSRSWVPLLFRRRHGLLLLPVLRRASVGACRSAPWGLTSTTRTDKGIMTVIGVRSYRRLHEWNKAANSRQMRYRTLFSDCWYPSARHSRGKDRRQTFHSTRRTTHGCATLKGYQHPKTQDKGGADSQFLAAVPVCLGPGLFIPAPDAVAIVKAHEKHKHTCMIKTSAPLGVGVLLASDCLDALPIGGLAFLLKLALALPSLDQV